MKYFYFLLILTLGSCKEKINDFYQGKVLDENGFPLEHVVVEEYKMGNRTKSDSLGYFKLKRSENWLGSLVFSKEGYESDTPLSLA